MAKFALFIHVFCVVLILIYQLSFRQIIMNDFMRDVGYITLPAFSAGGIAGRIDSSCAEKNYTLCKDIWSCSKTICLKSRIPNTKYTVYSPLYDSDITCDISTDNMFNRLNPDNKKIYVDINRDSNNLLIFIIVWIGSNGILIMISAYQFWHSIFNSKLTYFWLIMTIIFFLTMKIFFFTVVDDIESFMRVLKVVQNVRPPQYITDTSNAHSYFVLFSVELFMIGCELVLFALLLIEELKKNINSEETTLIN